MTVEIKASKNILEIYLGENVGLNNVIRSIPAQRFYDANKSCWQIVPSPTAVRFLQEHLTEAVWHDGAKVLVSGILRTQGEREQAKAAKAIEQYNLDYTFKTTPYEHQKRALFVSAMLPNFGLFMEMGTGKSKVAIDNAAILFYQHKITAVLVICPNSVKRGWAEEELEKHLPEDIQWRVAVWDGGYKRSELGNVDWLLAAIPGQSLPWLIMNYEATITDRGSELIARFLRKFNCLMICDESQKIKTPKAKRTKQIVKLGRLAKYRRILTGTPITNNPMDLYSQFYFLDQAILGHPSFFTYRARYAIMGGFEGRQIIAYKHLDELEELIKGHSFRVRKADCLDLPPRVYEVRHIALSPEQLSVYQRLKEQIAVELQGQTVTSALMLTKLLRFQQLIGGAIPGDNGKLITFSPNPRLDELVNIVEDLENKVVIWSRFRHEVLFIAGALRKVYGEESTVVFYGEVDLEARRAANLRFQTDPNCRFFVATPATGGVGVNLSAASTEIFYSNDFDLGNRIQAEERLDRADELTKARFEAGKSTLVIDLVADKTVDVKIVRTLKGKKQLADIVLSGRFFTEEEE